MASRSYNNETRRRQQAALKERIASATAELHAEQGAVATSYADIARRAGVSLPTVYNHFPSQHELIAACTGHAAQSAPPLPAEAIMQAADLESAATLLVGALDRIHAYYEPWMAWREHRVVPALGALAETRRRAFTGLLEQVLARHATGERTATLAAVWESLLHFELWHRLARQHELPRACVRSTLVQLLLAACGPQPAAPPPRPSARR